MKIISVVISGTQSPKVRPRSKTCRPGGPTLRSVRYQPVSIHNGPNVRRRGRPIRLARGSSGSTSTRGGIHTRSNTRLACCGTRHQRADDGARPRRSTQRGAYAGADTRRAAARRARVPEQVARADADAEPARASGRPAPERPRGGGADDAPGCAWRAWRACARRTGFGASASRRFGCGPVGGWRGRRDGGAIRCGRKLVFHTPNRR